MKTLAFVAVPLLLAACAAPVASRPAVHAGDTISFEWNTWGQPFSAWTLTAPNQVTYERATTFPLDPKAVVEVRRLTLSRADVEALYGIVETAKQARTLPTGCTMYGPTDGPYGALRWSVNGEAGELGWGSGCARGNDADRSRPAGLANAIVERAAETAPVVSRHPVVRR